jgi:hypothetical protein
MAFAKTGSEGSINSMFTIIRCMLGFHDWLIHIRREPYPIERCCDACCKSQYWIDGRWQ